MTNDMTTGSSVKKLLVFSLPLLIGTIFQQFYNMVDSIIVGKFLGTEAFAAVGTTGSITFLVLGLAMGACSGFAIPVAQDFGARDEAGVRRCVANIIYISVAFTLIITLVTTFMTRQILVWMGTPAELLQGAYDYLIWIFIGMGALIMYNMLAGILRSLGDSRTPLVFLIISSLLNIALDFLLVAVWKIGIRGASIATVIAQLVSGIACLFYIIRHYPILRLTKADMKLHMPTVKRLLGIGIPMGLQFSITAVGSIILQASVNALGTQMIAAISLGGRIQALIVAPFDAFAVAVATFAGQNFGAGKIDRIRRGVLQEGAIVIIYAFVGLTISILFSETFALLFVDRSEMEIIGLAKRFLICNASFYIPLGLIHVFRNTLQGVGFSKAAMLAGVFELVARALMGIWLVPAFGFAAACFAHPVAWIMADIILIPLYIVLFRRLRGFRRKLPAAMEG